jgi:nicotinate-nucleotide adenylyltransferase
VRVGILGGSFNPAHQGHLHIARLALRRLRLHQVWLMVSPGNPLKPSAGMASFADRLASARAICDGRHVIATGIEAALGTRYTFATLAALRRRFPLARFVWLMGADNLEQLPRWNRWREIAGRARFAVLPRPSYNHRALAGAPRFPSGAGAGRNGAAGLGVPAGAAARRLRHRHPRRRQPEGRQSWSVRPSPASRPPRRRRLRTRPPTPRAAPPRRPAGAHLPAPPRRNCPPRPAPRARRPSSPAPPAAARRPSGSAPSRRGSTSCRR